MNTQIYISLGPFQHYQSCHEEADTHVYRAQLVSYAR